MTTSPGRPIIGVFDSGFGGLTVLRELLAIAPGADYIYLGDSARLPYGSKSRETVAHYASSSARFLAERGADLLVVACNSASALALPEIEEAIDIPVVGVIEPGAASARAASRVGRVCVVGTQATVSSHAYAHALGRRGIEAEEKACPLFVPLIEEGWTGHPVTEQVASIYIEELRQQSERRWGALAARPDEEGGGGALGGADAVVLGCTHYPLLAPLLSRVVPAGVTLIDPARATAEAVAERLARQTALRDDGRAGPRTLQVFATDSADRFRSLGARFLGHPVEKVELIALPE